MKKTEALDILGLKDGFTEDELKRAHRKKVVENHPDRFQDPAEKARAEERTKRINEANDVLKSGKWEPEFGPTVSGYGANPYNNPYAGYGGRGAEWVEVDPEMFRRWAQQAAQQQQQQGYDPFNPFVRTYSPPTAEQQAARARQDMRTGFAMLAVKAVICGFYWLANGPLAAMVIWATITLVLLLASRLGGCAPFVILLLIPTVFMPFAQSLNNAAMGGGTGALAAVIGLFAWSLYIDFRDIRNAVRRYRVASGSQSRSERRAGRKRDAQTEKAQDEFADEKASRGSHTR